MQKKVKIGKLEGILNIPKQKKSAGIIMVHGFGGEGFEEEFEDIANKLSLKNYTVLRFLFSGYKEEDLKQQSISKQISELNSVISFLASSDVDKNRIGIIAQSLGVLVSVLLNDPRVKSMVLLSPGISMKDVFSQMAGKDGIKKLENKNVIKIIRRRTKKERIVGWKFWKDVKKFNKITVKDIKKIKIPLLITHGTDDSVANYKTSEALFKLANQPKEFKILKNGRHVAIRNHKIRKEVIKLVTKFFDKYLK